MKYLTPVLTKDDKIDLIDGINKMEANLIPRLDKQAKWLSGLITALFALAIAILKVV